MAFRPVQEESICKCGNFKSNPNFKYCNPCWYRSLDEKEAKENQNKYGTGSQIDRGVKD